MVFSLFGILILLIAVAAVLAWRKKGLTEFVAVVASTLGGFLVGLVAWSPVSMGLAQIGAFIGLTLSVAVIFLARAVRRAGR